jgi:hypothetical protein
MVQVHADFVAYLKFGLWVLGWQRKECTIIGIPSSWIIFVSNSWESRLPYAS